MASLGLINKVKYSKWLYSVYYYVGSFAVKVLGLFVRKDPQLIIFSSFGGRKYDDSPKCIYEQMLNDNRFDNYKIVWAFMSPEKYQVSRGDKVKTDTIAYYKTLLRAKCWITNSTMERGLSINTNRVFYFNSWHGTPVKLMGSDIDKSNTSFSSKGKCCPYSVFCAQSKYDADIFKRSFNIPEDVMKIIGLPRNDELANDAGNERKNMIKEQLGISENKKVILYAPTFREYSKDEKMNCVIAPPIHIEKWRDRLGKDYILLFRAHYEVAKVLNIVSDDFIKDVSSYPNLNELMIVSDILLSDYSSIFFDYSIMGRPMLCFAYDYDEYNAKRGLYFDIREELDCNGLDSEDEIINEVGSLDFHRRELISIGFRDKYVSSFGSSTKLSLDLIYEGIK